MSFLSTFLPGVVNFLKAEGPHLVEDVQKANTLGKELVSIVDGLKDSRSKTAALTALEEFSQHLFNAFQSHAAAIKPAAKK